MKSQFRFDIQALRAVAVLLVLVFHVWPDVLPAGYIGVDIFFVISGFLITGLLHRELQREGRIALLRFYMRRFRRLMPAASLVIGITMALSLALEPGFRQPGTGMEGIASALYWQNWLLAWRATDYLEAERALGPLTHFWSLSIEEQFYLFWPLGLACSGALALRRRWSLRAIAITFIALISAASLATSAVLAHRGLPEVYFVTHARIWELGLGALLALVRLPRPRISFASVLTLTALATMVASAFMIPNSAGFPGLIGLVPTLAAAAFIHAGAQLGERSWFGLLESRAVRMIGDASYSIYLWHWPLVYFATIEQENTPGLQQGIGLIIASLVIGWLSWRFVEEPLRYRREGRGLRAVTAAAATATGLFVSVVAAGALYTHSRTMIEGWEGVTLGREFPGAMALTDHVTAPPAREPRPPLAALKEDLPVIYENGCHIGVREVDPQICVLHSSSDDAPLIVLVGDSHAANWVPTLQAASARMGWRLISITKSACSLTVQPHTPDVRAPAHCTDWSLASLEALRDLKPDLVLVGRSRRGSDYATSSDHAWVPGLVPMLGDVLTRLNSISGRVAVIADTPRLPSDPANCLARQGECAVPLDSTRDPADALLAAAQQIPGVGIIDLRDWICPARSCPAVIGNVVVWRDHHHLTATYSRSLAPEMVRRIQILIGTR